MGTPRHSLWNSWRNPPHRQQQQRSVAVKSGSGESIDSSISGGDSSSSSSGGGERGGIIHLDDTDKMADDLCSSRSKVTGEQVGYSTRWLAGPSYPIL